MISRGVPFRNSFDDLNLKFLIVWSVAPVLCLCMQFSFASEWHAIVDSKYAGRPGAVVDGTPKFATIQDALASIQKEDTIRFILNIKNGLYYEKLNVDIPNVYLIGESRDSTVITYDASADTPSPAGGTYGTQGSFTLQISAPGFRAENLTIENSFDYPANAAKSEDDPTKVQNPQAVALMTTQGCDRAEFCNCAIKGFQDTLFADAGRHYFYDCEISGHVDFIFGAGQAVFESCDLISRDRQGKNPTGYLTAPSTSITYPYGFLFIECRLLKETPALPAGSVRLGRPWHPGADLRADGSAVFIRCFMADHIGPEGYAPISSRDSNGERIWFEVGPDSRFFEFGSHGPGAIASPARPTIGEKEAAWYTTTHVLNGWRPSCSSR